jgi:hypothetical protein
VIQSFQPCIRSLHFSHLPVNELSCVKSPECSFSPLTNSKATMRANQGNNRANCQKKTQVGSVFEEKTGTSSHLRGKKALYRLPQSALWCFETPLLRNTQKLDETKQAKQFKKK